MAGQIIPSGVETLVLLCCGEYRAVDAGWDASGGPNAWVGGSVPGLYQAFATIPFGIGSLSTVTELDTADGLTDLNTGAAVPLPWDVEGLTSPGFVFGADPTLLSATFSGPSEHVVSVLLSGGTSGQSCVVNVLKNGATVLAGSAVVVFGTDGTGTASFTAVDLATVAGDTFQVVGQSTGTPSSSAFAVPASSQWVASRVTAPTVSGRLAVYDSGDAFIMDVDTDSVSAFDGALRFGSLVPLTDHGRIKVFVTQDTGADLILSSDVHVDLAFIVNPPPTVATCGGSIISAPGENCGNASYTADTDFVIGSFNYRMDTVASGTYTIDLVVNAVVVSTISVTSSDPAQTYTNALSISVGSGDLVEFSTSVTIDAGEVNATLDVAGLDTVLSWSGCV